MFTTEMSLAVIKFHYNITFHLVCYEEISLVLSLVSVVCETNQIARYNCRRSGEYKFEQFLVPSKHSAVHF